MRLTRDLLSGLFFAFFGVGLALIARQYPLGTAAQMGPGYFPFGLGVAIALIGCVLVAREAMKPSEEDEGIHWEIKPLALILAAIAAFGLLIESAGVVLALVVMTFIARLCEPKWRPLDLAILTVVLIAIALGVFVYGLRIPLPMGPF
ncbi:membrane protein [Agaricicola taiwanensis]|uniref:Membrane protein n=1 Tax=Agaricicola taiwanensis TaxID=591372 RepID=A0A8J2VJZ9_9RHOB|nr:tripartite tricarboxylate transporter TctB family protein [Agaricicola taiwanensis]GGE28405.1 membrane protein [Agaricicola taiwanensis]